MRKIKFRAWDKDEKQMCKVYQLKFQDNGIWHINPAGDATNERILMQYTGLKDKNGKEIYEGDIIKNDKYQYPHKIIYTLGSFVGKQTRGKFLGYAHGMFFDRFEVIGNIWENGGLLNDNK